MEKSVAGKFSLLPRFLARPAPSETILAPFLAAPNPPHEASHRPCCIHLLRSAGPSHPYTALLTRRTWSLLKLHFEHARRRQKLCKFLSSRPDPASLDSRTLAAGSSYREV